MDCSGSLDWDTVQLPNFDSLPWIVSDRQRPILQRYKRLAIQREKELDAEKQRQLNELRHYVEARLHQLEQSEARRHDDVPNEGVVHSHSLSAQNETSAHAGSLLKATMDDTHISEEGDKTRAWMVSVLQPLAESPSVPPEVSFSSTQQEHDTTHQHKFVDGYLQGAGTQVEMNRTRDATSSAVPHISGTQMSSFLVPSQSGDLQPMRGPAVGREPAPFPATFSEQTESSTSHDPTWRPLTGRKLDRWRRCKVHAIVKGYLTRRLYQSNKVQHLRTTAQDAEAVLGSLPRDTKKMSRQDLQLKERVTTQLVAARIAVYEIFFELPSHDRMAYIAQTRQATQEKAYRRHPSAKAVTAPVDPVSTRKLSSATLKKIEQRKQATSSPSTMTRGAGKRSVQHTTKATKESRSSTAPSKRHPAWRPN